VIATPDGRVGRYLEGLEYDPNTLRLSLVELSEGEIGSFVDDVVLYCHRFDPDKGYVAVAMNVMRLGGALTVLALGGVIGGFLVWEFRKRVRAA
jgi:protein SCO1/2